MRPVVMDYLAVIFKIFDVNEPLRAHRGGLGPEILLKIKTSKYGRWVAKKTQKKTSKTRPERGETLVSVPAMQQIVHTRNKQKKVARNAIANPPRPPPNLRMTAKYKIMLCGPNL